MRVRAPGRFAYLYHKAPLSQVTAHARTLAYLNDSGKILAALRYQFGGEAPMPCRAVLDGIVEARREEFRKARQACARLDTVKR